MGEGRRRIPGDWMWAYAARLLEEAERLQRSFFQPAALSGWRPPADLYEQDGGLLMVVALPGVPPERVTVAAGDGGVVVRGVRPVPATEDCVLHRMEIPHGLFERHLPLPTGRFRVTASELRDGCLYLTLTRGAP